MLTDRRISETAKPGLMAMFALQRHGVDHARADVTSIVMIGAEFDLSSEFTILSRRDDDYLAASIQIGMEQQIGFSRSPTIHMVNRRYGRDFLLGDSVQGQMSILCHVPYDPKGTLKSQAIDHATVKQSPLCDTPGIWHRRLLETGARWIFNVYGDGREIPLDFIDQPPYHVVLKNKKIQVDRWIDFLACSAF